MFAYLNKAILNTFPEPFVYKGLGGDVSLNGVFTEDFNQDSLGTAGFGDKVHRLDVDLADVTAAGVVARQKVTVRGIEYHILDVQSDLSGMASLTLRRFV